MSKSLLRCAVVTAAVLSSSAALAPAAGAQGSVDRVADGNAELPVSPWTFNGFGKVPYGAPTLPTTEIASGTSLFGSMPGNAGATMTQRVNFADRASTIDAGTQPATVMAKLGGVGTAGAQLTAQPIDAGGAPIGGPLTAGAPTAADRLNETLLVPCRIYFNPLPTGTRALNLTITSPTGGGLADDIAVYDATIVQTSDFRTVPYNGRRLGFASGGTNNCDRASIGDAGPPATAATPRITIPTPAPVRAGKTVALRATIRNSSKTANAGTTNLRITPPTGLRLIGSTRRSLGLLKAGASKKVTVRLRTSRSSKTSNLVRLTVTGSNVKRTTKSVRVRVTPVARR